MTRPRSNPPAPPATRPIVRRLLQWFPEHARELPWRRTLDPYAIWVSEIMLQQTQVKTVIPYHARWLRALPDVPRLAAAPLEQIHKLWEGLGYYLRARNLQRAAAVVMAQHAGQLPEDFEALLALPGIGRYTAGAISSIAFNQPRPIVDGNVVRVLARLFVLTGNPKDRLVNERFWSLAGELVTTAHQQKPLATPADGPLQLAGNCSALNQSLMELGATLCTPTKPQCGVCPLRALCVARRTDTVDRHPETVPREAITHRRVVAFIIRRAKQVLVRQRPTGVVNAHFWEFPNVEISRHESDPAQVAAVQLGLTPRIVEPLGVIRHSITRYRIALECFALDGVRRAPAGLGVWRPVSRLAELAFTAAHRKLLKRAGFAK